LGGAGGAWCDAHRKFKLCSACHLAAPEDGRTPKSGEV
jgi:hypothetical protein